MCLKSRTFWKTAASFAVKTSCDYPESTARGALRTCGSSVARASALSVAPQLVLVLPLLDARSRSWQGLRMRLFALPQVESCP